MIHNVFEFLPMDIKVCGILPLWDFMISHPLHVLSHLNSEGLPTRKIIRGILLLVVVHHYGLPYPSTRIDLTVERDPKGSLDICLMLLHDFGI
jgi:hypothetical protein